jgi:hypothetical protein
MTGKPGVIPSADDRRPHQTPSGSTTQMRAAEVLGRRIWLQHYHVSDHMEAGMAARYQVLP